MRSLLANDEKLLKRETVDSMFEPQLNDDSQKALMEKLQVPAVNNVYGALPTAARRNWAFAGLVNCEDIDERRRAGAVGWIGLPNMNWVSWPDPFISTTICYKFGFDSMTDVVRSGMTVQLVFVDYLLHNAFRPEMPNASI